MHRFLIGLIFGFLALAATAQMALADTTTLVCTNNERPNDPPITIILDQAHGTVTISSPGQQYVPATSNTYTATFNTKEIKFIYGQGSNQVANSIDRVTGIYTVTGREVTYHYPCHVGKAQF